MSLAVVRCGLVWYGFTTLIFNIMRQGIGLGTVVRG